MTGSSVWLPEVPGSQWRDRAGLAPASSTPRHRHEITTWRSRSTHRVWEAGVFGKALTNGSHDRVCRSSPQRGGCEQHSDRPHRCRRAAGDRARCRRGHVGQAAAFGAPAGALRLRVRAHRRPAAATDGPPRPNSPSARSGTGRSTSAISSPPSAIASRTPGSTSSAASSTTRCTPCTAPTRWWSTSCAPAGTRSTTSTAVRRTSPSSTRRSSSTTAMPAPPASPPTRARSTPNASGRR